MERSPSPLRASTRRIASPVKRPVSSRNVVEKTASHKKRSSTSRASKERRRRRHSSSSSERSSADTRYVKRFDKRRWIKPDRYDGKVPLESFLTQFEYCAAYNGWDIVDRLAYLRTCLSGAAAEVLWTTGPESTATYDKLLALLRDRFGNEGQAQKFRAELRSRRQQSGESLRSLFHDIRRLTALAFPGPTNATTEVVACEAFLEALSNRRLAMRVREREPKSLEEALRVAIRMEAYSDVPDADRSDDGRRDRRGQARGVTMVSSETERLRDECDNCGKIGSVRTIAFAALKIKYGTVDNRQHRYCRNKLLLRQAGGLPNSNRPRHGRRGRSSLTRTTRQLSARRPFHRLRRRCNRRLLLDHLQEQTIRQRTGVATVIEGHVTSSRLPVTNVALPITGGIGAPSFMAHCRLVRTLLDRRWDLKLIKLAKQRRRSHPVRLIFLCR